MKLCRIRLPAAIGIALILVASVVLAAAKNQNKTPPNRVPTPITISRVRFEVREGRVLTTTDLTLPAGQSQHDDLDIHVAYGGPGGPRAFDAQLVPTPKAYLVAPVELEGTKLAYSPSPRAPLHVAFTMGRPEMAGVLVHLPARLLSERRISARQPTLRLREVRDLPHPLADGTYELLARLGSYHDRPFVLGLVELVSDESIDRAEARFCGVSTGAPTLFVSSSAAQAPGIAAPLAQRTVHDDLCLRFGPLLKNTAAPITSPQSKRAP